MRHRPRPRTAVILKLPMLYRSMIAFTGVMQQHPVPTVFSNSKAHRIKLPLSRNPAAPAGIAQIAVVAKLWLLRQDVSGPGGAVPAESDGHWQPMLKRPRA